MKYVTFKIIISLFSFFIIQEYYGTPDCVFGEVNFVKGTHQDSPDRSMLIKNSAEESGFISEDDIVIMIDEAESEIEEGVLQEAGEGDAEKIAKEREEKKQKEIKNKIQDLHKRVSDYLRKGQKYEARNELSEMYFKETDSEIRNEIRQLLDTLNKELVFSTAPSPDATFYVVNPGDSLVKIAKEFDISYEFIMRINRKSRTLIRVGERLKILKGDLSLLVDKSDYTLTVLLNGYYIKQYPVGIGKSDKTPVGVFVVDNKLINPTWYSPEGVYKYGHPKNVLGTRWIGFEDKDGLYGYGIHGTSDPDSIGKDMSNGCIRLRNEDVEELFDFVKAKTRVVMQE